MDRDKVKSIASILLVFIPLLILGRHKNPGQYEELLWAFAITGFLYFIRYEIINPTVRKEIVNPLKKTIAICVKALLKEEEAIRKLHVIQDLED